MEELSADTTPLPPPPQEGETYEDVFYDIKQEILDNLTEITYRADEMAGALRLRRSTLPQTPKMADVIDSWLKLAYNVNKNGPPCWNSLVQAVANDNGGAHRQLARRLAAIYKDGTYTVKKSHMKPTMNKPQQECTSHPSRSISTTSTTSNGSSVSFNTQLSHPISESTGEESLDGTMPQSTISTGGSSDKYSSTSGLSSSATGTSSSVSSTSTGTSSFSSTGASSTSSGAISTSTGMSSSTQLPSTEEETINSNEEQDSNNCHLETQGNQQSTAGLVTNEKRMEEEKDEDSFVTEDGFLTSIVKAVHPKGHVKVPSPLVPYKMNEQGSHGHVLIINNIQIDGREERLGAVHDGIKLYNTMTGLGYQLVGNKIHTNCTAYQIKQLIKEAVNIDHTHNDSFICCLMSHGDSDFIYGIDDKHVYLDDIRKTVINCKSLLGKPKIFFIQACRGGTLPDAHKIEVDDHNTPGKVLLPEACDVFFGYATSPNTKACRFTDKGSWYITELCKAFHDYPLQDLLTIVQIAQHEVSTNEKYIYTRKEGRVERSYRQSPQMVSTLTRKVYFKVD